MPRPDMPLTRSTAIMVLLCASAPAAPRAGSPAVAEPPRLLLTGKARLVVSDALPGVVRRLAEPRCQLLFDDFTDRFGRPLRNAPRAAGRRPIEVLDELYFADGEFSRQCRDNPSVAAFTSPQSRVIHVCGARFADAFARDLTGAELLIIHELLHTLGLGENPPTSAEITAAVRHRCGQ